MNLIVAVIALFVGPVHHPAPAPAPAHVVHHAAVRRSAVTAAPATTTTTTTTTEAPVPWCVVYWSSSSPISNPAEDNDLSGPDPHGARSMACSDVDGWEAQQPSDWTFTVAPDPGPTS